MSVRTKELKILVNPNGGRVQSAHIFSGAYFSKNFVSFRKSWFFTVLLGDLEATGTLNPPLKLHPEAPQY